LSALKLHKFFIFIPFLILVFLFIYPSSSIASKESISIEEAQKRFRLYHDFSDEVKNAFELELKNGNNEIVSTLRTLLILRGEYYKALSLSYEASLNKVSSEDIFLMIYAYHTKSGRSFPSFLKNPKPDQLLKFNQEHPHIFEIDYIEKKAKEVFERDDSSKADVADILAMIYMNLPSDNLNYKKLISKISPYLKIAADNGNFISASVLSSMLFYEWVDDFYIKDKSKLNTPDFYLRRNEWDKYNLIAANAGIPESAALRSASIFGRFLESNDFNNDVCKWSSIASKLYSDEKVERLFEPYMFSEELIETLNIEGNSLTNIATCILVKNKHAQGNFSDAIRYLELAKKLNAFQANYTLMQLYLGLPGFRSPQLALKEIDQIFTILKKQLSTDELIFPSSYKDLDWIDNHSTRFQNIDPARYKGLLSLYHSAAVALVGTPNIYELTNWSVNSVPNYGLAYVGLEDYFNYKKDENYKVIEDAKSDFQLGIGILDKLVDVKDDAQSYLILARLFRHDERLDKYIKIENKVYLNEMLALEAAITQLTKNPSVSENHNVFEASVELANILIETSDDELFFLNLKRASLLADNYREYSFSKIYKAKFLSLTTAAYLYGIGTEVDYYKAYKSALAASSFDVDYNEFLMRNNLSRLVDNVLSKAEVMGIKRSDIINSFLPKKRIALVVGASNYTKNPLKNPLNDAIDLSSRLTQFGFDVSTLLDPTYDSFRDSIRILKDKINKNNSNADVVFYFSGHGINYDNSSWLLPVDAKIDTPKSIIESGINLRQIIRSLDEAETGSKIIILDACRDFLSSKDTSSLSNGLDSEKAPSNMIIAYSTDPGNYSIDNIEGENSVYTMELLKQLNGLNTSSLSLFTATRNQVLKKTKGKQTPWETSSLTDEFNFLEKEEKINFREFFE